MEPKIYLSGASPFCQTVRNREKTFNKWIDHREAFDSMPHSYIIDVLKMYKVDDLIRWLNTAIPDLTMNLMLHRGKG